jgi:eukaryotic-like serine/threonine-protein kinase
MIADRYRLERKVGGGRVSAVWRVQDEVTESPCALKLLHRSMHKHPEALTRFSLEERLARELTGPRFPERVGSGSWDGLRYIAWRWHDGESLRTLFERNPKQDAPTVLSIVQEACQALTEVHGRGYTHGDLKPENLFFAERGENARSIQLKLISFGVASRMATVGAASPGLRRPGQIVGTPLYLSPDLILGRVPLRGQADLWALAVVVYEALTGRAPFLGEDLGGVLQAILDKQAPLPSQVADNLPATLDRWWTQALSQAFTTPGEFATALARALGPVLRTSHTQRSASMPERLPAVLEALAPLALTGPGTSSTSSTAAGIGRPENAVSAPSAAPGAVDAPAASMEPASSSTFAPLPSPLRDFASNVSRKTLVGITPPISLLAGPMSAAPVPPLIIEAIEGAPCRPIEISEKPAASDSPPPGEVGRRPANPTVPFPRPRFLPRVLQGEPPADEPFHGEQDETHELGDDVPRSWRGSTTRTLRFVLTSPDHKPQRVAAALVCAAAALVIFMVGRSPVAGTGAIGAAPGLTAVATDKNRPVLADPNVTATDPSAASNPADPLGELARAAEPSPEGAPPAAGQELAPGLVVPASPGVDADVEAAESSERRRVPTGNSPGSAGAGDPANPGAAHPSPHPASAPKAPVPQKKALPAANPQHRAAGDFDFGI